MTSRREFLLSAASVPLAAGFGLSIESAIAAPPSKKFLATAAGTPTPPGLLIGSGVETGMFKNLIYSLASIQSTSGYAFPAILDEYGYPKSSPSYNIFGSLNNPSSVTSTTQMVLKWTGTGSVQLARGAPGFTIVSGAKSVAGTAAYNLTVTGTNPRVVFTYNGAAPSVIALYFLAGAQYAGMGKLIYCKLSDEAALDAATTPDALFDDDYVASYKSLNPKVFRPMQWANPCFGNVSRARYIADWQNSINIVSDRWAPGAWAGTTMGINSYSCSLQPDGIKAYVDGEMIQLQFASANTSSSVTLNSGNRGAVRVVGPGGDELSPGRIAANSMATLTYDAVLKAFLWQNGGQTACMPYEMQVGFANRLGASYWCNLPNYIDDASVISIVNMIRDRLISKSCAYIEYGNEIWNFGFQGTGWANAKGTALGFPSDNGRQMYGWYGLRLRQIMSKATEAWLPRASSELKRAIAVQAFGPILSATQYRMEGQDLSGSKYPAYAAAGFSDYNVAPNRPIDYCDVLSYATYFSGAQCTNFDGNYMAHGGAAAIKDLLTAAENFATGTSAGIASALAFLDSDCRSGTLSTGVQGWETLKGLRTVNGTGIYAAWEKVAATYGKNIECYEGGFESNFPSIESCNSMGISQSYGGPTGKIANLLVGYKKSSAFASLVQDQLADFFAQAHSKTAAWYQFVGPSQWSITTGDALSARYQSWNGLTSFKY